jgi:NAD(P)-dependent dehydrogenase (short-subunit alcohol dehydrogenase family)
MATRLRTYHQAAAIVTGAASGIGRALATELAVRGAAVVLADIDGDDAETVASALRGRGLQAKAQRVDVRDFAQMQRLVADTLAEHGRLDYFFNNAGIVSIGTVADYSLEVWTRTIDVNVRGVAHGVQAAYPQMLRQGYGHIVNTASTAGLTTVPGITAYSMSKHAVVGLSAALRAEAHAHGVRVSALCPGVIRTAMMDGGRHGVLMPNRSEAGQRSAFAALGERLRPMNVDVFAGRALDQVARNVDIIIVPGWWRIGWWLERACRPLALFLARKMFEASRARLGTVPAPDR